MKDLIPVAGNGLLDRRAFLRGGAALAAAMTSYSANAEMLTDAPWSKEPGELVPPADEARQAARPTCFDWPSHPPLA